MIRSLAALFAKKTAIVAIAGVTVIGGATFALAVDGNPPEEPVVASIDCNEADNAEHEDCLDPADATDCEDPANAEHQDCQPEAEECQDLDADGTTCLDDELDEGEDEGAEGDVLAEGETDEPVAEHPENHGKYVSEAAKGGGECADLEAGGYKKKGQCVADVARSDIGKKGAEDEPAPTPEMVIEQPAPVQEPAAAAVTEEQPKDKPVHAGPPAGKGGGKGKG